ncbi:DUF4232 domain-containing protein [Micromonospora maritima]|uniref:DUF4232 domain-containing protein n=1 Tax=Micromonospora maritima TaxID=986711 RepID=UPI00157CEA7E|nr:DUF4232 domain-containing protein [Micromonospora maritima]
MRNAAARLGIGAGLALLTACAPTPRPADPRPTPPVRPAAAPDTAIPTPACSPEGIRIVELGVSAAMGLRAMSIELVNCGDRPYRLRGYPAVALRDVDGDPVTVRVVPGAAPITSGFDDPPTALVLRPGERAGAALVWRNLVTDATVVATDGVELDVAPVAGRPAYPVALDGPIDLGTTGRLGVSAWKRRDPAPTTEAPAPSAPVGPPSLATTPVNPL